MVNIKINATTLSIKTSHVLTNFLLKYLQYININNYISLDLHFVNLQANTLEYKDKKDKDEERKIKHSKVKLQIEIYLNF